MNIYIYIYIYIYSYIDIGLYHRTVRDTRPIYRSGVPTLVTGFFLRGNI